MQIKIKKANSIAIAATILLLVSASLVAIPVRGAGYGTWPNPTNLRDNGSVPLPAGVTPDVRIAPTAYLSFRPNPVGLGQVFLVNVWLDPGPSVVRYLRDFTITITKPDGTTDVIKMDSYFADSTAWFEYVADQLGTWKLKFEFPGGYFPAGNYTMPPGTSATPGYTENYTRSVYYEPAATKEQTLTVQSEIVKSWPESPLPNDYWTRPVMPENREWISILGDYPWRGPGKQTAWPENTNRYWSDRYSFTPYVQAPNSAHIIWKRQGAISGIYGGDVGCNVMQSGGGTPTIVFQSRAYQTVTKPMWILINGTYRMQPASVWQCYDLRTGEVYWELTDVTAPSVIEYSSGLPSVPGAEASVSKTASLLAISGNRLIKYNPSTGAVTLNISIPTFAATTYYMNEYALSVQTVNATAYQWRLINWTTAGTTTNFTQRIISNITYARDNFGQFQDFETGICFVIREPNAWTANGLNPISNYPYVNVEVDSATGIRHGIRIMAYSLITGQLLYNNTIDNMPYTAAESPYSQQTSIADHGKLAILMRDGAFRVYDQYTGKLLFKTETMDYPWDEPAFGAYSIASAYGMFYRFGYGGIYAFSWETGKIVWKYTAPAFSAYETPYTDENGTTVYSFNAGCQIADGKIYTYNTEHTPTQPITRGWGLHCINATTGELIWKIKTPGAVGPIADGYLTVSCTDGYMYVFGKGKSKTTLEAPLTTIPLGQSIVLKGTVLDMSPAQAGTPCVAKESMTTQMEYLHKQMAIDGLWHNETITGVKVSLDTVDPNGNYIHIGDVTTDGYSGTFGFTWEPEIPGQYKVTATFMGDDSYGSSFATTYVSVSETSPATSTPAPAEIPDYMPIMYAILAVGIIAMALGIVAVLLALRKR